MTQVPVLPSPLPSHPRLLASIDDRPRLRRLVESDPVSRRIFASLKKHADSLLELPPAERVLIGRRMLYTSREVLERIGALALSFQITGDSRYADRAIRELLAASAFVDWNPQHHLDVGEMALAVAVGYDWLYGQLSESQRAVIAAALKEKGILPSYQEPETWFIKGTNNWNQVCHAGISAAAIAIADLEPGLAEKTIRRAIDNLHFAADLYAPDGVYPEGPMYWNYGTNFHVILSAALECLTGSTQGTDQYPGFHGSADYVLQATTPSGKFYCYADCRPTRHMIIPLFWFARQNRRPDLLQSDLEQLDYHLDLYDSGKYDDRNYRTLAFALLWRDETLIPSPDQSPVRHWYGQGTVPVAFHRSAFGDPDALFLGIKGGSPSASHGHMDGGSFMLQADGVVWAADLGMQDYDTLESINVNLWDRSQDGTGWTVFRLGPESHNILRFNQARQIVKGSANFLAFETRGNSALSILDLGSLYENQVAAVQRGFFFYDNRAVLIRDEWTAAAEPVEVAWQMITQGKAEIQGNRVTLTSGDKICYLQVITPQDATIEFADTATLQQPYDAPNPGMSRLTLRTCTEPNQKGSFTILLTPGDREPVHFDPNLPLSAWPDFLRKK